MKTCKLRHRVLIQQKQKTRSPTGAVIVNWVDIATVWASIEPSSVKELLLAKSLLSEVTAKIIVRVNKRITIDSSMRIKHKEKIYNIAGVLSDVESGLDYLTLPVSEGLNDG